MARFVKSIGLVTSRIAACLVGVMSACTPEHAVVPSAPRPAPSTIALDGRVIDAGGRPVPGAEVALITPTGDIARHATSDAAGTFRFDASPGTWALSAHATPFVGGFADGRAFDADTHDLLVELPAGPGVTVRGRLDGAAKIPPNTFLAIATDSTHDGDVWAVAVKPDATFSVELPARDSYAITATGQLTGAATVVRIGEVVDATVEVSALAPPPDEVTRWLAGQVALRGTLPDLALDDLAPLNKMIGNARVVALGEATHGSAEFFQLKHRFLEYLVTEKGFTTFAIEASEPECRAIDAYIHGAPGDPKAIAAALGYWTWRTEEVLALIEWMRAWNGSHAANKVRFVGFDMQSVHVAKKTVADAVRAMHPELLGPLLWLDPDDEIGAFFALTAEQQHALETDVDAIARELGAADPDTRHDVAILQQWIAGNLEPDDTTRSAMRDRAMAANIAWTIGDRDKTVVWAHNMHVDRSAMGGSLAARFGSGYVAFGFVFERGAFRAVAGDSVDEVRVGAAPMYDVSAPFARTHIPILVADLRTAPRGIVSDWLAAPHPMRETGAIFSSVDDMTEPARLSRRFDAVIFVDSTTPSHPLR